MSGLNQHALTKAEDHFLQVVSADFDKNQALTEHQEERLELFTAEVTIVPNRNHFAFKEAVPRKQARRPSGKYY